MIQEDFCAQFDYGVTGTGKHIFQFEELIIHYTAGLHSYVNRNDMNTNMFISSWFFRYVWQSN